MAWNPIEDFFGMIKPVQDAAYNVVVKPIQDTVDNAIVKPFEEMQRNIAEEHERQRKQKEFESVCRFVLGVSEEDFEEIATRAAKTVKRIKEVYVISSGVHAIVESQSKISEWNFWLDFNDHGYLTGKYQVVSENPDSRIPESIGNKISDEIFKRRNAKPKPKQPKKLVRVSICPVCKKSQTITAYCKTVRCHNCFAEHPFEGFEYQYSNKVDRERGCPKCGGVALERLFDQMQCMDCGFAISDAELSRSVLWYCDHCETFMNLQEGFNIASGVWICTQCGFKNDVTEKNIE